MKKQLFLIVVGLTLVNFSAFSFGGKESSQSQTRRGVSDVADVAEVADSQVLPRRNPLAVQAEVSAEKGGVTALPAKALAPEAERLPAPVYAISGVKGQAISETNPWEVVDVWVYLPPKVTFSKGLPEGADVTEWTNLPEDLGLEAYAHRVRKGANSIAIYISGTPKKEIRGYITVRIPDTYLSSGTSREFASANEAEYRIAWEEKQTQAENQ